MSFLLLLVEDNFFPFDILQNTFPIPYVKVLKYLYMGSGTFICLNGLYIYIYFAEMLKYQVMMFNDSLREFNKMCRTSGNFIDIYYYQIHIVNNLTILSKRYNVLKW